MTILTIENCQFAAMTTIGVDRNYLLSNVAATHGKILNEQKLKIVKKFFPYDNGCRSPSASSFPRIDGGGWFAGSSNPSDEDPAKSTS